MPAFEVIAKGFDGGTDKTDDRVLWIWSEDESWLRDSLKATYCADMTSLNAERLGLEPHDYDFIMPKDVQALHDRLRALADIPRLDQVVRGHQYRVAGALYPDPVTFIASDPDDGAYLICKYWDTDKDEQAYIGVEASDLRFLPAGENQKP